MPKPESPRDQQALVERPNGRKSWVYLGELTPQDKLVHYQNMPQNVVVRLLNEVQDEARENASCRRHSWSLQ